MVVGTLRTGVVGMVIVGVAGTLTIGVAIGLKVGTLTTGLVAGIVTNCVVGTLTTGVAMGLICVTGTVATATGITISFAAPHHEQNLASSGMVRPQEVQAFAIFKSQPCLGTDSLSMLPLSRNRREVLVCPVEFPWNFKFECGNFRRTSFLEAMFFASMFSLLFLLL